ncbi:S-layer homology domain-containing protein [Psychrobacillus glaciei]|uniref:S-layer homology domain-containing protein n=1 Tax=Psychrobacillus glaciei TaxID=2283160 RepID=A0A5J6SJR1_9BACI|nr:S-layer homology domain-containing protein [Psychrobacillus glaciei]QFF98131.1 S-layer homology domain-containing protein [Psychrobacillus glaciei]
MNIPFKHQMKRLSILIAPILLVITLAVPTAFAKVPDFNGGILDEYMYEEVFFLAGYPLKFTGKATLTEKESKNQLTSTYKFTLTSEHGDKLTRNVVYVSDLKNYETKGQTTSNTVVKSYTEKIAMADKSTYTLDDYQFSQSSVIDNRPATDYYSGNVIARKIYLKSFKVGKTTLNDKITVYMTGRDVGYKNFWGSTDTQFVDYEIETPEGTAFVTSKVSDSKSRVLEYEPHTPTLSSFVGGHAVISSSNMVSEYTYNIPFRNLHDSGPTIGNFYLNKEKTPKIERLIVPKFRDIANHWSRPNIEKLYSIGIFDESSNFFSPDAAMKKDQFTISVAKAVDLRVLEEKPAKKNTVKKALFEDLDPKDPNYGYIESALNKGIVSPVNAKKFGAKDSITRAQAAIIIVRSLGLEGRAPSPGYKTHFIDDNKIPKEAKDSIYVASQLGLIEPDKKNRINANEVLTRGKASQLLVRYLNFLESDLKQNYRDDMLYFN